jgi:hypothetical protein
MRYLKGILSLSFAIAVISCHKEEDAIASGKIQFSVSSKAISGGRITSVFGVLVSVEDTSGKSIFERRKLTLYSFGDSI